MASGKVSRTRQFVSLVSLIVFTALVFVYLWWGRFHYSFSLLRDLTYASLAALVLGNHLFHRDSLRSLGFRVDNIGRASVWYGGLSLLVFVAICVAGSFQGSPEPPALQTFFHYLLWATAQQHVLQNFLRRRGQEIWGACADSPSGGRSALGGVLVASSLFAVYHLPNGGLMLASFVGAILWCGLFMRHPNLPWAVLSQTLLALTLAAFFKEGALQQFEVGLHGYRYQYYGNGVSVAGGYDSSGRPFVVTLPGPDRGRKAQVRIFDTNGTRLHEWIAFPELGFSGVMAVGNLGYGPGDEVVVTPGPGGRNPALVKIFDTAGRLLQEMDVTELENGYGAWVAVACGRLLVAPGPAPQAPQRVIGFKDGRPEGSWDFPDLNLVNGVRVTATCSESGTPSESIERLLLWGSDIAINPSTIFLFSPKTFEMRQFETLTTTFGAQVTLLRWRPDVLSIAVAPGPLRGYPPLIGIYSLDGKEFIRFSPYGDQDSHGASLGRVDVNADGRDELIVGEGVGPGRPFTVRLYRPDGELLRRWEAYP